MTLQAGIRLEHNTESKLHKNNFVATCPQSHVGRQRNVATCQMNQKHRRNPPTELQAGEAQGSLPSSTAGAPLRHRDGAEMAHGLLPVLEPDVLPFWCPKDVATQHFCRLKAASVKHGVPGGACMATCLKMLCCDSLGALSAVIFRSHKAWRWFYSLYNLANFTADLFLQGPELSSTSPHPTLQFLFTRKRLHSFDSQQNQNQKTQNNPPKRMNSLCSRWLQHSCIRQTIWCVRARLQNEFYYSHKTDF